MIKFMLIVDIVIFIVAVLFIIVSLITAQYGIAWLIMIPALISGGNIWAIICGDDIF